MADTYAQILTRTQAAITAILAGAQSASIDGRTYTKANFNDLVEYEKYLIKKIRLEGGDAVLRTNIEF